jgi:hypothetical protein
MCTNTRSLRPCGRRRRPRRRIGQAECVPGLLPDPTSWRELLAAQDAVVTRAQAIAAGWTDGQVTRHLLSGRWRRLHHGVFVTHTGPVSWRADVWAGLLHAGPGAVASHRTAARLQGLVDEDPSDVELLVPWGHRVRERPGIVVRSSRALDERRHPSRSLPQTRVEHTVLDLTHGAIRDDDVVGWVLTACQRRATTPDRLAAALQARPRQRHRGLLLDVLVEAKDGIASALESHYHGDVELPHGLPRARREHAAARGSPFGGGTGTPTPGTRAAGCASSSRV